MKVPWENLTACSTLHPSARWVALTGVVFVMLIGWRLIPVERGKHDSAKELEDLKGYIAEAAVSESSPAIGNPLRALEDQMEEYDVQVLGLSRRGKRLPGSSRNEAIRKGDVLIMEGGPEGIDQFAGAVKLTYAGSEKYSGITAEALGLMEVVVPESSRLVGRSAMDVRLLYRQGVNLLGISRRGQHIRDRIRKARIYAGDILLLQGAEDHLPDVVEWLGCLPIAERGLEVVQRGKAWTAVGVFAAAIAIASLGWIYLPLALSTVVVIYILLKIVPLSRVYESVEWSVIVLLASMIPISMALEATGGAALIAEVIVDWTQGLSPVCSAFHPDGPDHDPFRCAQQRGHCTHCCTHRNQYR